MINYDIIAGIVRSVLPALVVYLVAHGWLEASAKAFAGYVGDAIIAVVMGLMIWWTTHRNRQAIQIRKVAAMSEVKEVVVEPSAGVSPEVTPRLLGKIRLTSR